MTGEPHVPQYRGSLSQTPGWTELQLGVAHLAPRDLEVAGEWMRVRVSQPAAVCGREDPNRKVHEGWIRWRSPEKGPWIWYPARGC